MEFRILGALEVLDGERPIDLGGPKQRALLGALLLDANRVVSRDRLIDALWDEDPTATADKALQVYVSQLRKLLGRQRLETQAPGYVLRVDPQDFDLARFMRLRSEGRLQEALALWRGPPLADLAHHRFAQAETARLEELRLSCVEEHVERDLERGAHVELVGEIEALVAEHPLRERFRAQLMLALYRSGRQAEALEAYQAARTMLVEELGIEPSRKLRDLHQAMLEQDPSLDRTAAAPEADEPPRGVLAGREAELAALVGALDEACAGRGRLVLLAGEPGIGKSRLAEEVAALAQQRGARVLVGRCWEAGGAPAYWPWVQSLRAYVRQADAAALRLQLGGGAGELAQIVPELRELFADLPDMPTADDPGARFRLFDAAVEFLRNASASGPLVLVVDDLHAADAASLLLLRFLARELPSMALLVVGAYRDVDPVPGPLLTEALVDLAREPGTVRIALRGLSAADIAHYAEAITAHGVSARRAAVLQDQTDGNPLFLGELLRLETGEALPQGVIEAIGRRLLNHSDSCRHVLERASVFGREFGIDALALLADLGEDEMFAALEEAETARLVGPVPGLGDRLRFSHMLVRDALYDELPAARRLRWHRRAGEALEQLYSGNLAPHVTELAHHFLEAGAAAAPRAIEYATRAGAQAASQLAYEEAARHYRSALRVLETTGSEDERAECELLLALGEALSRAGAGPETKAPLKRAAGIAERRGWSQLLARAALAYGGRFGWARASTDPDFAPLLERAIDACGDGDDAYRATLLARLAAARRDDTRRERRLELADEALEVAGRLGDPATEAHAIEGYIVAADGPGGQEETLELVVRLLALAAEIGDKEIEFAAHDHGLGAAWSLADRSAVDAHIAAHVALADELRQPAQHWAVGTSRAALALMEGRFADAETLMADTLALGEGPVAWNAGLSYRLHRFVLCHAQSRLAEVEELLEGSVDEYPALLRIRCALASVYAALGREPAGPDLLKELIALDLRNEYVDAEWLLSLNMLADACATVVDVDAATRLYPVLEPYEQRYGFGPVEVSFGSVARALGVLAATTGELDAAERHFATAIEVEGRMRARPWLAHAQRGLAQVLLTRGEAGDAKRAAGLIDEAIGTYRALGMQSWAARCAAQPRA